MVDNGIGIFASIVETQTVDPYPILHISYPDNVGFKGIRGATRVGIDQPVEVNNLTLIGDKAITASVVDVSVTGARIESMFALGEIGNKIQITMNVGIANIVRELTLDAVIRSCGDVDLQNPDGGIAYGVEFIEADEDKRLLLYAYVYAQIGSEEIIGG